MEYTLDKDPANGYRSIVKSMTGLDGEYGSWFMWGLKDAAVKAGMASTGGDLDRFYQQAANEINAAIQSNRLPSRRTFGPAFVDPEIRLWLPDLIPGLRIVALKTIVTLSRGRYPETQNMVPESRLVFHEAAMRRIAVVSKFGKPFGSSRELAERCIYALDWGLKTAGWASFIGFILLWPLAAGDPSRRPRTLSITLLLCFISARIFVMTMFYIMTMSSSVDLQMRYLFACRVFLNSFYVLSISGLVSNLRVGVPLLLAKYRGVEQAGHSRISSS